MIGNAVRKTTCGVLVLFVGWATAGAAQSNLSADAPDVVLSAVIVDKAAELNNDPVEIYEFVRNEIEFELYFGLAKGPEGTLLSGRGNDYDQAALLVSLLRAAGTPSRFVRGRIEADGPAWVGLDNGAAAALYLSYATPQGWAGIASLEVLAYPGSSQVDLVHVWVEAEVPMALYRGGGGDPRGLAWVPLDPSYVLSDWSAELGLNVGEGTLVVDYLGPEGLYHAATPKLPDEFFEDAVRSELATQYDPVVGPVSLDHAVLTANRRVAKSGVLPNGLPYALSPSLMPRRADSLVDLHTATAGWDDEAGTEGASEYRYRLSFHVCEPEVSDCATQIGPEKLFEVSDWSAAWEGKAVLLSFPPAPVSLPTLPDTGYAQCNGTDGLPIRVIPTVKVGGTTVHADSERDLCTQISMSAQAEFPDLITYSTQSSHHVRGVGGHYLAAIDTFAASPARIAAAQEALRTAVEQFPIVEDAGTGRLFVDDNMDGSINGSEQYLAVHFDAQEALVGGILSLGERWYFERSRAVEESIPALHHEQIMRAPFAGLFSAGKEIEYIFDSPVGIRPSGLLIDIGAQASLFAKREDGTRATVPLVRAPSWDLVTHTWSALEYAVWEEIAGLEGISTIRNFQVGQEAYGRTLLEISSLAEAVDVVNGSCSSNSCTDIDLQTYCTIKQSFAPGDPWLVPAYDASCPTTFENTTVDLRVLDRSTFAHRDWEGHAYLRFYQIELGPPGDEGDFRAYTFAIQKTGGVAAGGGFGTLFDLNPLAGVSLDFDPTLNLFGFEPDPFNFSLEGILNDFAGDPVSIVTGAFYSRSTDLAIPGRGGLGFHVTRSYNSRLDYDGPLGFGWIHTFDQHLKRDEGESGSAADDRIVWVREDGSQEPWIDTGTSLIPHPWNHHRLVQDAGGSFTLETPDGMRYGFHPFDGQGKARFDYIEDRNGNRLTATYDANQVLETVHDDVGRALQFVHMVGRLSEIQDWTGRVWRYTVDSSGDLAEFWDPIQSALQDESGAGKPWRFTYYNESDGNSSLDHNLKCWIRPQGGRPPNPSTPALCGPSAQGHAWMHFRYFANDSVSEHTDALGQTTSFSYNFFQKRTDVTHPDGSVETHFYDSYGNIIRFEDALGNVREYGFDAPKRERTAERDAFGFETTAEYDDQGRVIRRLDREGYEESFTYNHFDQPLTVTDRLGNRREWKYDGRGNLLQEMAELGGSMTLLRSYSYDEFGNVVEIAVYEDSGGARAPARTRISYDSNGIGVTRIRDALGHSTRFKLDALARPTQTETDRSVGLGPEARLEPVRVSVEYDALDRPVRTVDPTGLARVEVYDASGQTTAAITEVPHPDPTVLEPLRYRLDAVGYYDSMERPTQVVDGLGNVTTLSFDDRDRLVKTTTPLGHTSKVEYDRVGRVIRRIDAVGAETRIGYDAEGRVESQWDAVGRQVRTRYDREGRPTKVWQEVAGSTERVIQRTEYDAVGRPVRVFDGEDHESFSEFDELGRRIRVTFPVGEPSEGVTEYQYDLEGRLLSRTNAEGHTDQVRYDILGRVVAATDPLGRSHHYSYDELGQLVEQVNPLGERLVLHYDDRGLLLRRTATGGSTPIDDVFAYDTLGRRVLAKNAEATIRFEYDDLDRITVVHEAQHGASRLAYDSDGRVSQIVYPSASETATGVSVHAIRDGTGRLTGIIDPALGAWGFEYDAIGRVVRESHPTGMEREISYTPEGFLDAVSIAGTSFSETIQYSSYDSLGNPGQIMRGGNLRTVGYDERSRVVSTQYVDGTSESFSYDRIGNRTNHTPRGGSPLTYAYDDADQLVLITETAGSAQVARFTYDGAGRRDALYDASDALAETFAYDALSRLVSMTRVSDSHAAQVEYGPDGAVRRRVDNDGEFTYWRSGIEERGSLTYRSVDGPSGRIAEIASDFSLVFSLALDGTGNLAATASATAVTSQNFETFGTPIEAPAGITEHGFANERREGSSGLIHMGARHYDPRHGRFLQRDPLGIRSEHAYAYGLGNPYRFVDPTGLASQFGNLSSFNFDPGSISFNSGPTLGDFSLFQGSQGGGGLLSTLAGAGFGAFVAVNAAPYIAAAAAACPPCALGAGIAGAGGLIYDFTQGFPATWNFLESVGNTLTGQASLDQAFDTAFAIGGLGGAGLATRGLGRAASGLDDLARFRSDLGLKRGEGTLARLDIGGQQFYGINAHGQRVSLRTNAITRTHAEADAFQQAANAGLSGGRGRLFVDRDLCRACGQSGGVRGLARQLGLDELEVVTPGGTQLIRP